MKIWKEKIEGTNSFRWRGDGTVSGKRLRPVAKTKAEVEAAFDKARSRKFERRYELPRERDDDVLLDELVAEYVRDFDLGNKNRKRTRTVVEDFASRLPGAAVVEVTARDLRDFARARKAEFVAKQREAEARRRERAAKARAIYVPREPLNLSPHSMNKELIFISAMLNSASHLFEALSDYRPPRVPWESVPRKWRRRPLTNDEDEVLLVELRSPRKKSERRRPYLARLEVADLFEITLQTGMRPGECVGLVWPQVDFDASEIYLGRTKTGEDRFVPMNSRVVEILMRRREQSASKYVFPNPAGTRPRCDYYRPLRRAARSLGLTYGQRVENGFTPYSTRHTAATRMLRAGADISSVQEILGHSNATMSLHYSHATRATTRRAAETLVGREVGEKSSGEKGGDAKDLCTEQLEEV